MPPAEVLEAVRRRRPHVVLLDAAMEREARSSMIGEIKSDPELFAIAIVLAAVLRSPVVRVKIITQDGVVTLGGPVKNAQEKTTVASMSSTFANNTNYGINVKGYTLFSFAVAGVYAGLAGYYILHEGLIGVLGAGVARDRHARRSSHCRASMDGRCPPHARTWCG